MISNILLYSLAVALQLTSVKGAPRVTVQNGTIIGASNPDYTVESFLGIPYAQPPLGDLRFNLPKPFDEPWAQPLNATSYGPFCLGYDLGLFGFNQEGIEYQRSEDCLTLNIIRPAGIDGTASLPVFVWIHGGGFTDGGSGDMRYDMKELIATSVDMGMPTIGLSINYRLSGWGFLTNKSLSEMGLSNIGIHDQRTALAWIQENIAAFGGDPTRVTIAGESAGGMSVAIHALAYANESSSARPFRAMIAQSGGIFYSPTSPKLSDYDERYPVLIEAAGCSDAQDAFGCLRSAPSDTLNIAFSQYQWLPVRDGRTLPLNPAIALERGDFSPVPLLIGATTHDAATLYNSLGLRINRTSDLGHVIKAFSGFNPFRNDTIHRLQEQYSALDLQQELGPISPSQGPEYGAEWGTAVLLLTDYRFAAGRRISSQIWAQYGVPAYSYRFNTVPAGIPAHIFGATHFSEIGFMFRQTSGLGWAINPFDVTPPERKERYEELAQLMARMWLSFVNTLSPNNHGVDSFRANWNAYSLDHPTNMVFEGNGTSFVELDDWRVGPINLMRKSAPEWFMQG